METMHVAAFLSAELQSLANQYGNRQQVDPQILNECMEIVTGRFKHLGLYEIREAYRMWAAKELGDMPEAEMYGGMYQARHLSAVLAAYNEKRKHIAAALHKQADEARIAARDAAAHDKRQAEFEQTFLAQVEAAKGNTESWADVPEYWFESARIRGLFKIEKPEADSFMIRARVAVRNAMQAQLAGDMSAVERRELVRAIENQETIEAKAKVIARKMVVFEKLLNQTT